MRTYVAPLGFDSRRVVRPVLSEGIDEEDVVVLLQPATDSERGTDAYDEVEDVLTQVVPSLDLRSKSLPYTDFVETTLFCIDLIEESEGEVIVVLGGGARDILLPLTVATFSTSHAVTTVLQVSDIDGSVRQIPPVSLRSKISAAEATLLADLNTLETPLSITDIGKELDKSKSTVARHVNTLESEQLIETTKRGREKLVDITDSGRIFLASISQDQLRAWKVG